MKRSNSGIITLLIMLVAFLACDKEITVIYPKIETASVDEITNTSARVGGRISNNGGAEITERGIFWGTSPKPESSGSKLQSGSGTGIYYETLTGLESGVKYYVTAYALNSLGTAYGDETFFTTQISMPSVTTSAVTEYTSVSAILGGIVNDDGGFEITQRGIFWGTEPDPRLTGTKLVIGSGMGVFSRNMTGLNRANTYYFRAFATNIKGTAYGEEISFSTEPEMPKVFTSAVINITPYTAETGGNVSSDGGTEISERGIYWGLSADPVSTGQKLVLGSGTGIFKYTFENLHPATDYFIRSYAVNSSGTSYGEEIKFRTTGELPSIEKVYISYPDSSGMRLNIQVDSSDLRSTVYFEYGLTDSYGTADSLFIRPRDKDTTFFVRISGLEPLITYHYRVRARNELGWDASDDYTYRPVITGRKGSVKDPEGIAYKTIGIGYQEWMTENLRSVMDKDGRLLPVLNDSLWAVKETAGRCWFANDSSKYAARYGALYNWYAVSVLACPDGWRMPGPEDYQTLTGYVGSDLAGLKLKDKIAGYWKPVSGISLTDEYGFSARGGGKRLPNGEYDFITVEGNWWTSESYSTRNAYFINIIYNYNSVFKSYTDKKTGMSVRCMRDR